MNRGIAEYYHQKIKEGKLSTSELKEALYIAIRTENAPLLELALSKLPPDEDKWDEDAFREFICSCNDEMSDIAENLFEEKI